nr:hypothetical protein GCM10025699_46640 [Microbacterium flavescens]
MTPTPPATPPVDTEPADTAPDLRAPRRQGTVFATLAFLVLFGGDVLRNGTGWWGWGLACGVMVVASVVVVVRNRPDPRSLPRLLGLFLLFAVASIAWSQYPSASIVGIPATLATTLGAVAVAWSLPWPLIVAALGRALRIHIALSLLFELVVATLVRQPVCPVYLDCSGGVPDAFYWSRDVLFEGGRIQGLQGNSNILGVLALLALVVTAAQWSARTVSSRVGWVGVVLAVVALVLTRSATTVVSGLAVLAVLGLVVLVRRTAPPRRPRLYAVTALVVAVAATAVVLLRAPLLGLLGRSSDLTGRTDIWASVSALGAQHPVAGWGWVSYWIPWVSPSTTSPSATASSTCRRTTPTSTCGSSWAGSGSPCSRSSAWGSSRGRGGGPPIDGSWASGASPRGRPSTCSPCCSSSPCSCTASPSRG